MAEIVKGNSETFQRLLAKQINWLETLWQPQLVVEMMDSSVLRQTC